MSDILPALKAVGYRQIHLMPFMIVAGDHAQNDMAGDGEDSWKSILEANGFEVSCHLMGLGELPEIRKIFVEYARAGKEIKEIL